jgi:hypothetical protein
MNKIILACFQTPAQKSLTLQRTLSEKSSVSQNKNGTFRHLLQQNHFRMDRPIVVPQKSEECGIGTGRGTMPEAAGFKIVTYFCLQGTQPAHLI